MSIKSILDERGILLPQFAEQLKAKGNSVSCECPGQLIHLFEAVKAFTKYQDDCLVEKPSDQHTHTWLKSTSVNMEHMLSSTIISLARMEGLLDDNNQLVD